MKHYLTLALAAFALVLVAPSASAVKVRYHDPASVPPNGYNCDASDVVHSNQPCNIYTLGTPDYAVTFLPCNTQGIPVPPAPADFSAGYCLWMNNVTAPLPSDPLPNTFTFTFTVPHGGSMDGIDALTCDSTGPTGFSATNNCPGVASVGDTLAIKFRTDPALSNGANFWLYTDFLQSPGIARVTASVSVPEPGELGLFGLGLLLVGVGYGWEMRRKSRRTHGAV